MKTKLNFIVFVLIFNCNFASAIEWLPEFQSLTETEQSSFEGPILLGPEYQSDVITYRKPYKWEYLWLSERKAFDSSIGSISAAHFLIDQRLKVHTDLSKNFEFRFTYLDERNRERDSTHHILEFIFWPTESKKLGFGFYGEPSLYKREDDTGVAFYYRPHSRHEIKFFNTFVDVTRQKRNDRSDKYVAPSLPYSRGFVGRLFSNPENKEHVNEFFEYAFRYETKTVWEFPDSKYKYGYWKWMGMLFGSYSIRPDLQFNARLQMDRKFEKKVPTDLASAVVHDSWQTDRIFFNTQLEFKNIGPNERWNLIVGHELSLKYWQARQERLRYRDFLPNITWDLPAFGVGETEDRVQLGYDFTYHQVEGPKVLLDPHDTNKRWDHRFNLIYEFSFKSNATLRFMATADLDKLGSKDTWEGGNGELRFSF